MFFMDNIYTLNSVLRIVGHARGAIYISYAMSKEVGVYRQISFALPKCIMLFSMIYDRIPQSTIICVVQHLFNGKTFAIQKWIDGKYSPWVWQREPMECILDKGMLWVRNCMISNSFYKCLTPIRELFPTHGHERSLRSLFKRAVITCICHHTKLIAHTIIFPESVRGLDPHAMMNVIKHIVGEKLRV